MPNFFEKLWRETKRVNKQILPYTNPISAQDALRKAFKSKPESVNPLTGQSVQSPLTGQNVQSRFGTPVYDAPQGLGVSGTSGAFGQLGGLAGYQDPGFKYTDIVDPPGLTGEALAAWRASQIAGQERQATIARNMARQRQIETGYGDQIKNNRRFSDTFDQMYSGYGDAQRQELDSARQQQLARTYQSARFRGLENTTIRDSLGRGVESDYQRQRVGLEDKLTQNRINLMAQGLGREQNIDQQRQNYLTGIQDEGPSFEQVMGYSLMPEQIKAAELRAFNEKQAAAKQAKKQKNSGIGKAFGTVAGAGLGLLVGQPLLGAAAGGALGGVVGDQFS